MYCGLADCAEDALAYFIQKRFPKQPRMAIEHCCQLRYIFYFEALLSGLYRIPKHLKIDKIVINDAPDIADKYWI